MKNHFSKITLRNIAKISSRIFLVVGLFCIHTAAIHAATLQFSPATATYNVGDTFSISATVTSTDQAINAVSSTVSFPKDKLQFISASKNSSLLTIWAEEPAYDASSGTISMEGVLPNPGFTGTQGKVVVLTFKAKAQGTATLAFISSSVLANDGLGTNVLTNSGKSTITINPAQLQLPDQTPPVVITQTPAPVTSVFNKITSSTHPDSTQWYANANPSFEWNPSPDVTGFNSVIDQNPATILALTSQGMQSSYQAHDVVDGNWYFHLRLKTSYGWLPTMHFAFNVDATKPEFFGIEELTKKDPKNPVSRFLFSAKDTTSGIVSYQVQVDNTYFVPWIDDGSHVYETKPLSPGKHTILATVLDGAGNSLDSSIDFVTQGLDAPNFTDVPTYVESGSYLIAKGKTYPNVEVDVYLNKSQEGSWFTTEPIIFRQQENTRPVTMQKVMSDNAGNFTFVSDAKLSDGTYQLWAKTINEFGAESNESVKIAVPASHGMLFKIGIFVVNIFSLLLAFIACIITLVFLIIHSHHNLKMLRDNLMQKRD